MCTGTQLEVRGQLLAALDPRDGQGVGSACLPAELSHGIKCTFQSKSKVIHAHQCSKSTVFTICVVLAVRLNHIASVSQRHYTLYRMKGGIHCWTGH